MAKSLLEFKISLKAAPNSRAQMASKRLSNNSEVLSPYKHDKEWLEYVELNFSSLLGDVNTEKMYRNVNC